jgi:2-polyprenyl-6-methoxyphenol hydroxylase-like FAD-dependent oxidoreductase
MKGIIIGGGIGGLTTAIALNKHGIDADVYEQAPQISEVGAAVWMAANALKILERLGISQHVINAGKDLEEVIVCDTANTRLSSIDLEWVKSKYGFGTVAIHRAVLQKILLSNIPVEKIHTGKRFKSFTQNGKKVEVSFEDGSMVEADFLVCADGLHSRARSQMHPGMSLRYSEQTCWRLVAKYKLPEKEKSKMYEIWGRGKGMRAAYSQINGENVYAYFTNQAKAGEKDDPSTIKDLLRSIYRDFPPIVTDIIDAAEPHKIIRNDLFDFKPIKGWSQGKVCLLGDAAHATTPNLGQGACQAMEDAYAIAKCLHETKDPEQAFIQFEKVRLSKAHYITNTSWMISNLTNTSGLKKTIVKSVTRLIPERIQKKQFDRIYSVEFLD